MERETVLSSFQREKERWTRMDRKERKEIQKEEESVRVREKEGGKSSNGAATNDSWKEKEESADVCIWSSCSLNGSVAN